MKKTWHDQHLKTCTCKKCDSIPKTKKFSPPAKKKHDGKLAEAGEINIGTHSFDYHSFDITATLQKAIDTVQKAIDDAKPKNLPSPKITLTTTGTQYALKVTPTGEILANPAIISGSVKIIYNDEVVGFIDGIAVGDNAILHCKGNATISISTGPTTGTGIITSGVIPGAIGVSSNAPEEKIELLDSSNPFAKALDAWQTGKASWTKRTLYRREPTTEGETN